MRAYLELHQVEVAAFHPLRRKRMTFAIRRCRKDSSLWPYSSPYTLRLSADGR